MIYIFLNVLIFTICLYPYAVRGKATDKSENNLAILVDLSEKRLYLIDKANNSIIKSYIVASGRPSSPSPAGTWKVIGMGKWSDGFGSRWIGLNVPWGKYGIHGTNKPGSIGSEASHGCIRMFNKDIEELYTYVKHGMLVVIYASPYGPFEKGLKTLKPGDRGSAIFEVQRIMKDKGYYPGYLDGIYGDGMKKYVIKFRKDNNLTISHDIDYELYKKLGISLID
jgi:hypothetical protein